MAATRGTYARLLVDEFDFSGETAGFDVTLAISEEDCTVLTSGAAEYTGVLAAISIEHNGYMAVIDVEGAMEKELWERLGVMGSYVAALVGIDVPGHPAYVLDNTFGASMVIAAPATGIITLDGSWGQGKGGHRGIAVHNAQVSATGAQTAFDLGLGGTQGGEAYLFVRAIGGTASGAAISVQHSTTSGGTYTNLGTAFSVSDVGAQKITFAGTVNRWARANVTSLGGATSLTFALIVCSRGVTQ